MALQRPAGLWHDQHRICPWGHRFKSRAPTTSCPQERLKEVCWQWPSYTCSIECMAKCYTKHWKIVSLKIRATMFTELTLDIRLTEIYKLGYPEMWSLLNTMEPHNSSSLLLLLLLIMSAQVIHKQNYPRGPGGASSPASSSACSPQLPGGGGWRPLRQALSSPAYLTWTRWGLGTAAWASLRSQGRSAGGSSW